MQIIVNYKRNDNKHIPPYPPLITRVEPPVRWWNKPLGPYYTVGDSLACSAVVLIVIIGMIAAC